MNNIVDINTLLYNKISDDLIKEYTKYFKNNSYNNTWGFLPFYDHLFENNINLINRIEKIINVDPYEYISGVCECFIILKPL